jgi:DSF synthase
MVDPLEWKELEAIVDVWTDAALGLDAKDMRMMGRLVRAQDKLHRASNAEEALAVAVNA